MLKHEFIDIRQASNAKRTHNAFYWTVHNGIKINVLMADYATMEFKLIFSTALNYLHKTP